MSPRRDPLPPSLLMVDATAQRGVKAPFARGGDAGVLIGSPACDPALGGAALNVIEPAAAAGWSSFSSQLTHLPYGQASKFQRAHRAPEDVRP